MRCICLASAGVLSYCGCGCGSACLYLHMFYSLEASSCFWLVCAVTNTSSLLCLCRLFLLDFLFCFSFFSSPPRRSSCSTIKYAGFKLPQLYYAPPNNFMIRPLSQVPSKLVLLAHCHDCTKLVHFVQDLVQVEVEHTFTRITSFIMSYLNNNL